MGNFDTLASRFNQFISNIELLPSQRNDAKTKYDGVCKKLHDYYFSTIYDGSTKLLIGSYGKGLAIRPPRDIDVIFKMPWSKFGQYDDNVGNGQSQLLQDIKSVLSTRYVGTDIRGDGQVVVIPFLDGHKVEVLPAWEFDDGSFYMPDTHDGGSWKKTHPRAEIKHIDTSNLRSNGNTKKLIKMIKKWQWYCSVPIKSIVIELRAVNYLNNWKYYSSSAIYYDWMIRDYFSELLQRTNYNMTMPGITEKIYYGDAWLSKAQSAYSRAQKACEYESDGYHYLATDEWKKIFGDSFWYVQI